MPSDITTGAEEFGGPVTVKAKYPGHGDNSHGGYVIFDAGQYAERQGLLLLKPRCVYRHGPPIAISGLTRDG